MWAAALVGAMGEWVGSVLTGMICVDVDSSGVETGVEESVAITGDIMLGTFVVSGFWVGCVAAVVQEATIKDKPNEIKTNGMAGFLFILMLTLRYIISCAFKGFLSTYVRARHPDASPSIIKSTLTIYLQQSQYPNSFSVSAILSSMISRPFKATSSCMIMGGERRRVCPAGIQANPLRNAF